MKREQRLQPIVRLEARREQASAEDLNLVQREKAALLEQLQQLNAYRADYRQKYLGAGRSCGYASNLRDLQTFLGSLDKAIAQLESRVASNALRLTAARRTWLGRRARTKAVAAVIEHATTNTRAEVLRAEQHEVDDLSKRSFGPK